MSYAAAIRGCGSYLPRRVVTNDELAARLDTSDEWIRQRSGIVKRHFAESGELTSDLAAAAGMIDAGISLGTARRKRIKGVGYPPAALHPAPSTN